MGDKLSISLINWRVYAKYLYKQKFIPADKKLISDVNSYFMLNCRDKLVECKEILFNIDTCTINNGEIIDRFGYRIDPMSVSTGTKLVSAKYSKSDEVISLVELGNANADNISYIVDGNVYIPSHVQFYDLPSVEFHGVTVNGLQHDSYEEASLLTGCEIDDINQQRELFP